MTKSNDSRNKKVPFLPELRFSLSDNLHTVLLPDVTVRALEACFRQTGFIFCLCFTVRL